MLKSLIRGVMACAVVVQLCGADDTFSAEDDALYQRYVSLENQTKCDGKLFTCKLFYIGYATLLSTPAIAVRYYERAYAHNIASVIDDPNARDATLLSDLANAYVRLNDLEKAQIWYQKAILAGSEHAICYLGRVYRDKGELSHAYEAFLKGSEKDFGECHLDLGTFYFNGIYVDKDRKKGAELWEKAYKDDTFGVDINFNMAVYHANITHNTKRYKYHLLKAALQGDEEARGYLEQKKLAQLNVSSLFLDEAISKTLYPTSSVVGNKFSYGYDLYYRFLKFFDKDQRWQEVVENESVVFTKETMRLSFGLKALHLEASNTSLENVMQAMRVMNETLYVDMPLEINVKLNTLEAMLLKASQRQKEIHTQTRVDSMLAWKLDYTPSQERVSFAIVIR